MSGNKASKSSGIKLEPADGKLIVGIDDLLQGDILLFRPKTPKIHQRKISAETQSPYTHAAIYVGDGKIAESNVPGGVRVNAVEGILDGAEYVSVLRSQLGFNGTRPQELKDFVAAVLKENKLYDWRGALSFSGASGDYFSNQLQFINDHYGRFSTAEEHAKESFICSGFVVACFTAVGIIGDTAQVAYIPAHFSPGHLSKDSTFGWLLGYLVPKGNTVASDDPCPHKGVWKDIGGQWWP